MKERKRKWKLRSWVIKGLLYRSIPSFLAKQRQVCSSLNPILQTLNQKKVIESSLNLKVPSTQSPYGWLSSLFGYPKYKGPYYNRDPKGTIILTTTHIPTPQDNRADCGHPRDRKAAGRPHPTSASGSS